MSLEELKNKILGKPVLVDIKNIFDREKSISEEFIYYSL